MQRLSGVDVGGWHPLTYLYEMIRYICFMYVCDLASRPPTSYGVGIGIASTFFQYF